MLIFAVASAICLICGFVIFMHVRTLKLNLSIAVNNT